MDSLLADGSRYTGQFVNDTKDGLGESFYVVLRVFEHSQGDFGLRDGAWVVMR